MKKHLLCAGCLALPFMSIAQQHSQPKQTTTQTAKQTEDDALYPETFFRAMDKEWERIEALFSAMWQQTEEHATELRKLSASNAHTKKQPNLSIQNSEKNDAVLIKIANIALDSVDATRTDDGHLAIEATPGVSVKINTIGKLISVSCVTQHSSKKDAAESFFGSQTYAEQELTKALALEKTVLDYSKEEQRLIVTIPYVCESVGKKIPVNIH